MVAAARRAGARGPGGSEGISAVQGLEINTTEETAAGIPVVVLRGEIDLHTCPELRNTLQGLLDAGKSRIVLNLAEVPYLDSAALGVLVDAVRRAREQGGTIHLVEVTPFVRRAFEITRLIKIFQVHDTVADALQAANAVADTGGASAAAAAAAMGAAATKA